MKTILASLVAVAALTTSALASEPSLDLRGVENAPVAQAAAKVDPAAVQVSEANTRRKVRVVLASPYGT